MKKCLFLAAALITLTSIVHAQQVMPTAYGSGIKLNYVRTWDAMAPITQEDTMLTRPYKDVKQTTAYFDGLGRPLQTVAKKGSLITGDTARDMVMPVVYDELGREQYQYLPFAANNTGSNTSMSDGKFKLNPFQQDSAFNKGLFSDETYYYSKTVFEASPAARPLETYAPGNNWVGTASQSSEANRRGIKAKYWVNTTTDSVRIWTVTDINNSFGTYASSSSYAAGTLYKNATLDEHHKEVVEFKDKAGKVILKKVQLTASADTGTGKGYAGWLCTYYIYDNLDQLRAVIQPKGVEALAAGSWTITSTLLDEQCFRYEYDGRGRMILKKVPGAGTVYMIYDARDRLVMTQDSNMRAAHKWLYTLYDVLNRPAATGLITDNTNYNNAAYHRAQAATSTAYPNSGSYTDEILTKTFYDDYSWRSGEGNPLSATRSTTYDSYLFNNSNTSWPYPQDATIQSSQLTGMVTGTKTKLLGTNTYLYTIVFYDDEGRAIQTQATNISGGTDINSTQYSWAGQPLLAISKQQLSGSNSQTTIILTQFTYDDLWRLTKTEKKISHTKVSSGAMPGSWTTVSQQEYDALGQLKKKKLGTTPVETLNYDYNIRGWMLGINRGYVKDTTSTANWFGFDLGYDKTSFTVNGTSQNYTAGQYNGNISGILWRSTGDDYLRKYDFTYDAANRLLSADFNQLNSNSFSKAAGINFSVSGMSYDVNGNILNMNQKGWKLGGSVTIDSLAYGYNTNSNRLNYVTDRSNDSTTKLGDFREFVTNTSQDYTYDGNGNLVSDANKKILSVTYNHLNLPAEINVATGSSEIGASRSVLYLYDATGNKLQKIVQEYFGLGVYKTVTTNYMNGLIYESLLTPVSVDNYDDSLQSISTEEGRARIKKDRSAIVYDYMIKDHLGNIRMVLTEEGQTDAYPVASMETAQASVENTYYAGIEETRYAKSNISGYPSDTYTNPNDYVAKLNGNGASGNKKVGPSIALKVMAGDTINIRANSYWKMNTGDVNPVSNNGMLTDIVNALAGGVAGVSSGSVHGSELITGGTLNPGVSSLLSLNAATFLADQGSTGENRPKAFLNWIMFDERFNYVSSSSGYDFVGTGNTLKTHTFNNIVMKKSGYIFVYVSNESQLNVYFDNLQVTQMRGRLLEESHYYPFGLVMSGISSKALNGAPENKKKYNGIEYENSFDINIGEAFFRTHDPQLGRWWQIDPRPNDMMSPYCAMDNNPIKNLDFLGDTTYIYTMGGVYKGVVYDNQKTNEVVMLSNKQIKTVLGWQKNGTYGDDVIGQAVRDPSVAGARITGNTISALNKQWHSGNSNENIGYLYVDPKTKEVQVSTCTSCGTSPTSASPEKLAKTYDAVSKKGQIIGVWHTHPVANGAVGSQPSGTSTHDFSDPLYAMKGASFGVGMIVNKSTATIYPVSNPVTQFTENRRDPLVTTPRYSKDYRDWQSTGQYGVFNRNITPNTYWTQ